MSALLVVVVVVVHKLDKEFWFSGWNFAHDAELRHRVKATHQREHFCYVSGE